jgi:amidase
LAGAVVPAKDLNLVAGIRFTAGSSVVALVPDIDDHVVTRMRAGDLVVSGKTSTPEFGLPCYTEPDVAPPSRTPWDLTRSAGGSSGGAAAAVAAGIASAAQGSDGGGSIRIPASVTGLVGLKPSRGRISNGPWPDGLCELGHQGVLARTVADAAALLDVLEGGFVGDPFAPHPEEHDAVTFLDATGRDPRPLRVGRYRTPVIAETQVEPHCVAAFESASRLLASLGHEVEDVAAPFTPDEVGAFEAVWAVGAASIPVPPDREGGLRPLTRWLRERGRAVSGVELAEAVSAMRGLARRTIAATAHCDIVLTPTLASLPALVGALRDDADPSSDFEAQKRFTPFTSPYNISGQPAVSLPLHRADIAGVLLPVGVQLVGRPGGERTLLALAAQLERAAPWTGHHPPLW